MSQKLFIGGLPFSTSTEELRTLFDQVPGVGNVTVVTDRDTGQSAWLRLRGSCDV